MQITKIPGNEMAYKDLPRPTDEDLCNEVSFILAEQLTKKLLDKGLITDEEYRKISDKNRHSFVT